MRLIVSDFSPHQYSYPLWSVIYVKIADVCFPDDKWWDATSSVIDMWIGSVYSLLCGSIDRCSLSFMDGDYTIDIVRTEKHIMRVTWFHGNTKVAYFEEVDLLYFVRQLLAVTTQILNYEKQAGNSAIANTLTKSFEKLAKKYHDAK